MNPEYSPTVDDLVQGDMLPSLLARRDGEHFLLNKHRRSGHCTEDATCRPHEHISAARRGIDGAHYPTLEAGDVVCTERRTVECGRRSKHMICAEADDGRKKEMLRRQIGGIRARIMEVMDGKKRVIVLGRDTPWSACDGFLKLLFEENPKVLRGYLVFKSRALEKRAKDAAKGTGREVDPGDLEVITKYDPKKPIFAYLVWNTEPTKPIESTEPPSGEVSPAQQTLCPDHTLGETTA